MDEPLIVTVIKRYYADWEPPADTGREWIKCLCPFHGESRPSAVISFEHNAFKCYACPVKGSAAGIIKLQEEVSFAEAQRLAEEISPGSNDQVPRGSPRQRGRRVFGDPGAYRPERPKRGGTVPPRIRSRTPPWA